MSDIILPGYEVVVPNEVYKKPSSPILDPLLGESPTTELISFSKFRIFSNDEVLNFIKEKAKEYLSLKGGKIPRGDFVLDSFRGIPYAEIHAMSKMSKSNLHKGLVEDLESYIPLSPFSPDRYRISFFGGRFLNQTMEMFEEIYKRDGVGVYLGGLGSAKLDNWGINMRLENENAFPNKNKLEFLIENKVKDSEVFAVRGNYDLASRNFNLLYETLSSSLPNVSDSSQEIMKRNASETLSKFYISLMGKLGFSLGSFFGMIYNPFGDLRPFDLKENLN